jgi:hypothetical protein
MCLVAELDTVYWYITITVTITCQGMMGNAVLSWHDDSFVVDRDIPSYYATKTWSISSTKHATSYAVLATSRKKSPLIMLEFPTNV